MKKLLLLTTVAMLAAVPAQAATVGPGGMLQGITYDISVSGGCPQLDLCDFPPAYHWHQ